MSTFYGATGMTPGCLYDLTLRGAGNDQLTVFCPSSQQGPVSWVRIASDGRDGEAVIETVVTGASNGGLARRHEYRLRDGWPGVLITTVLKNESAAPLKAAAGDRWTNFKRTGFAQGITWADAIDPADRCGYAYGVSTGAEPPRAPTPAGTAPLVEMKPGEELKFTRFVAVGRSPLEAVGLVAELRGRVGGCYGVVREKDGPPISTAQIIVRTADAAAREIGIAYSGADGGFVFKAPPGDYEAIFLDDGRETFSKRITIAAGNAVACDVTLNAASAVAFDIRDEAGKSLPCKAQFHALGETAWPYLGPENRAHGCIDQWHSEKGQFRVPLAPGKYRVIVTRGIEYSHLAQEVTLAAGQTFAFTATLKRLVDTAGWVSADYHNHSTPSGDNTCGTDDRLINLAAEHIEFAPTTEHNRLYDWRPHIDRLGLAPFIQTVPGLELTGSGAHFNSFPFKPAPFTQDNGAPVWDKDPRITGLTLRDWQGAEPDRWVQINHPDMVENFIDRDGDGQVDGGFQGLAMLIDGLETQNYQTSELLGGRPLRVVRDKTGKESVAYLREFIWLQMLNRGHRYSAMAVCDAHSVWGNGTGGWRMYMPSRTDDPAKIDWRENSRHAKAGNSILTTGPFLSVQTTDGAGPGDTTRGPGGVKLRVKVQCTDWIDIDRVQVLVNGRARKELHFTRASHPDWFGKGVVKFERTLDVPLSEDAHLIVVAAGEKSTVATGYGTSAQAKIHPFAYHNPIFVDVNGGGFAPNGDTLDWPLPVKKISVEDAKRLLAERGFPGEAAEQ
ncbi:MAG: CehA/McbA family metallohydrolase, partial [Chthoniobacteraceae bacterium]